MRSTIVNLVLALLIVLFCLSAWWGVVNFLEPKDGPRCPFCSSRETVLQEDSAGEKSYVCNKCDELFYVDKKGVVTSSGIKILKGH
jgi:DNA-directed RNA polymerase subunit RPC12/RpoP